MAAIASVPALRITPAEDEREADESEPAQQIHRIERLLAEADDDFQPAGSIRPEIELCFEEAAHPFQEEFEHEEVVADRYAAAAVKPSTPSIEPGIANEPRPADAEGRYADDNEVISGDGPAAFQAEPECESVAASAPELALLAAEECRRQCTTPSTPPSGAARGGASTDNCLLDLAETKNMNRMLDSLKQTELPPAAILPLAPLPVKRFAFPELTEALDALPVPESPKVLWPAYDDTKTVRACEETANAILRQMSLDRPTVLAFTSPGDGDGKTSLLAALAPHLAKRITGNTLVVDANLRYPDLTARLTMPVGEVAARSDLIYPTNLPRLNVLPAPARQRVHGFNRSSIEKLREGWPLVLLDMPSLAHPETAPLLHICDGTYLVVRLGHTLRRAVVRAARLIRHRGRLLGSVVVE